MTTRLLTVLSVVCLAAGCSVAPRRIAWGDVHGHTAFSDGQGSLDDYFTYARDVARLDFVIVTDHDFGHAAPWRMPKEHWAFTQEKADQYTVKGRFVAIAGYEWTSQPKYWAEWKDTTNGVRSERLFPGPPRFYNHKVVYFPSRVDCLFSAKEPAYNNPDLLAEAVRRQRGLIHNAHPDAGPEGANQFDYTPEHSAVIANSEIRPDVTVWQGQVYQTKVEQTLRAFLNRGGRTGFVSGSDTHEGRPAVRTAVLVSRLTRAAIFDALRRRHNYAVTGDRIALDFRIDGHVMGEAIEVAGAPRITVDVTGTDRIEEVLLVRDGAKLYSFNPGVQNVQFECVDHSFSGGSYYYVRVVQADKDPQGNPSEAWSSPIWVKSRRLLRRKSAGLPKGSPGPSALEPWPVLSRNISEAQARRAVSHRVSEGAL